MHYPCSVGIRLECRDRVAGEGKCKGKKAFPPEGKTGSYGSLRALWELAAAQVWVDNARKMTPPPKRADQFYLQTWPGSIGIKTCKQEVEDRQPPSYVEVAKHDSKRIDLFLVSSEYQKECSGKTFGTTARLCSPACKEKTCFTGPGNRLSRRVKSTFSLPETTNMTLYGPAFRQDHRLKPYDLDYDRFCRSFSVRFYGKWTFLVRLHAHEAVLAEALPYTDKVLNARDYPDLLELVVASDVIISDDSSVLMELCLTKKTGFMNIFAIDECQEERDLAFSLEE